MSVEVRMVWTGNGRSTRQVHHIDFTDADTFACGVDVGSTKSYRSLIQWLAEPGQYGNCQRCARSKAVKALTLERSQEIAEYHAEKARAREKYLAERKRIEEEQARKAETYVPYDVLLAERDALKTRIARLIETLDRQEARVADLKDTLASEQAEVSDLEQKLEAATALLLRVGTLATPQLAADITNFLSSPEEEEKE